MVCLVGWRVTPRCTVSACGIKVLQPASKFFNIYENALETMGNGKAEIFSLSLFTGGVIFGGGGYFLVLDLAYSN